MFRQLLPFPPFGHFPLGQTRKNSRRGRWVTPCKWVQYIWGWNILRPDGGASSENCISGVNEKKAHKQGFGNKSFYEGGFFTLFLWTANGNISWGWNNANIPLCRRKSNLSAKSFFQIWICYLTSFCWLFWVLIDFALNGLFLIQYFRIGNLVLIDFKSNLAFNA